MQHDMTVSAIYRKGEKTPNKNMSIKTAHDIRRANLKVLADEHGGRDELARKIGRDRNQVDQLMTKKTMGPNLARDIEAKLKLPRGWMDNDHGSTLLSVMHGGEEAGKYHRTPENKQLDALLAAWRRLDNKTRDHLLAIAITLAENKKNTRT